MKRVTDPPCFTVSAVTPAEFPLPTATQESGLEPKALGCCTAILILLVLLATRETEFGLTAGTTKKLRELLDMLLVCTLTR